MLVIFEKEHLASFFIIFESNRFQSYDYFSVCNGKLTGDESLVLQSEIPPLPPLTTHLLLQRMFGFGGAMILSAGLGELNHQVNKSRLYI